MNPVFTLFLIASVLLANARAEAGCFSEHVREALVLNRERAPLYSRLTGGASEPVSERLMALERRLLKTAGFEKRAGRFEDAGVPVICESYVPISRTPVFARVFRDGAPDGPRSSPKNAVRVSRLTMAVLLHDWVRVHAEAVRAIRALGDHRFNCLTRHFLESVARIAVLAPKHTGEAADRGLGDPRWLHRKMILGHLLLLSEAARIDAMAEPLQRIAVPILCQDVPPISYGVEIRL